VGLGLMGGSLALALGQARPDLELTGTDSDPAVMQQAWKRELIREGDPRDADVIFLAVPIPALPELLASLAGCRAVVTDMASTKGTVMRWAAAAGVDLVGGHPMSGRERPGLEAASADLFQGVPWILTRRDPVVWELVQAVGARPVVMDAEKHDRLVGGVSHAAFMVSIAYVLALASGGEWSQMSQVAGPGYQDISRLAAGDPTLYAAIAATNREPLADALRKLEGSLSRLRRHLEAGDARLVELFEEAKRVRDAWAQERGHASQG
jgi:prephenate dehydrogenase